MPYEEIQTTSIQPTLFSAKRENINYVRPTQPRVGFFVFIINYTDNDKRLFKG